MVPPVIGELSARWGLVEVGEPFPGRRSTFVTPVTDSLGQSLVLKVWRDTSWAVFEYRALAYWSGRGCVKPLAFDPEHGAILEERVLPGLSLRRTDLSDADATMVFAELAARLRSAEGERPDLPHIRTWLTRLEPRSLVNAPPELLDEMRLAGRIAEELLRSSREETVLHADLHHKNLLRADGNEWLAIDPKGIIGPPEADAAAFLRNPRQLLLEADDPEGLLHARTMTIADQLGDAPDRVAGWAYVLGVLAAAWALEDGEGDNEVNKWLRCAVTLSGNYRRLVAQWRP